MIKLTTLEWVPPFARGLVRDLRVRWALEEAGIPYEVELVRHEDRDTPERRAGQPFGQVPVFEEDGLVLFESGAILLHIGERSEILLPREKKARARVISWVFAALNSVEPCVSRLSDIDLFHANKEWARLARPGAERMVETRLRELAEWLADRSYLEDRFTVGDLLMSTVLRNLRHTDLVERQPRLVDWMARCEDRPAFQKALADQLALYESVPTQGAG